MIKGNTDITLCLHPNAVNDNKELDGVESQMKRTGVCL